MLLLKKLPYRGLYLLLGALLMLVVVLSAGTGAV